VVRSSAASDVYKRQGILRQDGGGGEKERRKETRHH
jgi:hypothetical protein